MDVWEPRTKYEREHLEKVFSLVEDMPRTTPLKEVSKAITAELDRWKFNSGFWLTEENRRSQDGPNQDKLDEGRAAAFWVILAFLGIATLIGSLVLSFIFDLIFGAAEVGFWLGLLGGLAAIVWLIVTTVDFSVGTQKETRYEKSDRVRTDLNSSQMRQIESAARKYLREVGLARFVALARSEETSLKGKQNKVARLSGLFDPALKPGKQQFGVSDEGAESLVAQWMRWLGVYDAEVTKYVGDGGIDVESSRYIAQVKNFNGNVGIASIRELAGVAAVDGRTPLFFTSGVYPRGADSWAQDAGIYLFTYDAKIAKLSANNQLARDALGSGLPVFDD
jgi:hypothetical protein